MTVYMEDHGGECCGRRHIFEIDTHTHDRVKTSVNQIIALLSEECEVYDEDYDEDKFVSYSEFCCEITLTDEQARSTLSVGVTLDKHLRDELKFKRVMSFHNPNSGNLVHVYLRSDNEEVMDHSKDLL